MAWMSDEAYEFTRDSIDKKITARSARNTRSHCGKSGAVRFPSDYLSAKELKAMNGECIKYASLKKPMTWDEFKALPDDIKKEYIKSLRTKFNVPDNELAKMFGIDKNIVYRHFKCYGLCKGAGSGAKTKTWNRDGWLLWLNGADPNLVTPSETPVEDSLVVVNEDADIVVNEDTTEAVDEAAVEDIVNFIAEIAAEVQKDLYPEDVKIETCSLEEDIGKEKADQVEITGKDTKKDEVQKHVDNYFRNEAAKEGYSVSEPDPVPAYRVPVIPKKGSMSFEYNNADDALTTIKCLLSNAKVDLTISWECV